MSIPVGAAALAALVFASCARQAQSRARLPLPLLEGAPARPKRALPSAPKSLRDEVADLLDPLRDAGLTRELARQLDGILLRMPDAALGAVWPYLLDGNERLALFAAEYFDRRGRLAYVPRGARLRYLVSRMENLAIFFDGPPHPELPHLREMKLLSRFGAGAVEDVLSACLRAPDERPRIEFSAVLASMTGESLPDAEAWRAWAEERSFEFVDAAAGGGDIDRREVARRLKGLVQAGATDLPALVGYVLASPAEAGRFILRMDPRSARKEKAFALAFAPSALAVPVLCEMAVARDREVRLNAALSLACHRSPEASPYLVRALALPDRKTRRHSALALALIADARAASALAAAWKYNLGEVADAAREGLERISGRELAGPAEFEEWFSAHGGGLGEQLTLAIDPEEKAWKDRVFSARRAGRLESLPVEYAVRFWVWKCDVYDLPFSERLVISDPFRKLVSLGEGAVWPLAAYLKRLPESQKDIAEAAMGRVRSKPEDVEGNIEALASALSRVSDKRLRRVLTAQLYAAQKKSGRPSSRGSGGPRAVRVWTKAASESERCIAASALGEIGGGAAEAALKAAAQRERSERVKRNIDAAMEALGL